MSSSTASTVRTTNARTPSANPRYRGFLLTLNYIQDENLGEPELSDTDIQYMVRGSWLCGILKMKTFIAQFERGHENGTLHLQAYVAVSGNVMLPVTVARKILKAFTTEGHLLSRWRCTVVGVKNSGADQARAFAYCKKDDTHALDYPMRYEIGAVTTAQGKADERKEAQQKKKRKKADDDAELLTKIRAYVDETELPTWIGFTASPEMDLIAHSTSWVKKCFNTNMERKRLESRVGRRYIEDIVILWGSSGSGKTTKAESMVVADGGSFEKKCWNQGDNKYFGQSNQSYSNEENILFEEMLKGHALDFGLFKRICDVGHKKGVQLPVKNSFAVTNHKRVIFTTNDNPLTWFEEIKKSEENFDAFKRRVTCLMYYPKKCPDGSYNQYCHHRTEPNWTPYCEDITMALSAYTYNDLFLKEDHELLPDFLRAGVTRNNCEYGDYGLLSGTWKWNRVAYNEDQKKRREEDRARRAAEEAVDVDVAYAVGEVPLDGVDLLLMADVVTDPIGVDELSELADP